MKKAAVLIGVFCLTPVAAAEEYTVCQDGCDFSNVYNALEIAESGDTITIGPGLFQSERSPLKSGVTIQGSVSKDGEILTTITSSTNPLACDWATSQWTIRDIRFSGGRSLIVHNDNSTSTDQDFLLEHCEVSGFSPISSHATLLRCAGGTIHDCDFLENTGFSDIIQSSDTEITECAFTANRLDFASVPGAEAVIRPLHWYLSCEIPACSLTRTTFLDNEAPAVRGPWIDRGDNCLACTTNDENKNGVPDECEDAGSSVIRIPEDTHSFSDGIARLGEDGGTIEVAAGHFFLESPINLQGRHIEIRGQVDQNGLPSTFIDGTGKHQLVVAYSNESLKSRFTNIHFRNGTNWPAPIGISDASPTFNNCTFSDNRVAGHSAIDSASTVYIERGSPTFQACRFAGNWGYTNSTDYPRPAILARSPPGCIASYTSKFTDCVFSNNWCDDTGCVASAWSAGLDFENCVFDNNAATVDSGVIHLLEGGRADFNSCVFSNNSAGQYGGVARNTHLGDSITFTSCTFLGNSAIDGRSLAMIAAPGEFESPLLPTIADCTFSHCCDIFPLGAFIDNGAVQVPNICDGCLGDVNCSGSVNSADLGRLLAKWGDESPRHDLDEDGVVNAADLGLLLSSWGSCP